MDNVKELLKKIDGVPDTDDMQEVEKWLKTRNSQIGKMQQTLKKTSDRYVSLKAERELVEAALKLLRKKAKEEKKQMEQEAPVSDTEEGGLIAKVSDVVSDEEEGGLVAKESTSVTESEEGGLVEKNSQANPEEEPSEDMDVLYAECARVMKGDDPEAKKQMYRKISIEAENGNADAIAILGRINDIEGKVRRAGRLWDMAADMGSPLGYYLRAYCWYNGETEFGFEKNDSLACEDYGNYLKHKKAVYLTDKFDRIAMLRFHRLSLQLDQKEGTYNRTENVEKYKKNLFHFWNASEDTCPEKDRLEALMIMGDVLTYQKQYMEAVSYYLKAGWDNSVEKILEVFYLIEEQAMREKLEARILQAREADDVSNDAKAAIYYWYGQRYEGGKDLVPDKAKAFLHYWEAEKLGSKSGKSKRVNLLMSAVESKDFLAEDFLISIGEEGYWDAYKYMGDRYEKLFGIDNCKKAQEYYIKGQKGTMEDICVKMCNKLTERIENTTRYNKAIEYLDTDRYMEAFDQLKKLAKLGLAEACYKVAEISEGTNKYLAVKLNGYLLHELDIRNYYIKAATAGMRPAIERMIDIYSYGLFGADRDKEMVKKWKDRLEKL